MEPSLEAILTGVCCVVAAGAICLMAYLAWRKFRPGRRHRRHHSRRDRYFGQ